MAIPFYDPNSSEEDEVDGTNELPMPVLSEQSTETNNMYGEGNYEYEVTSADDVELHAYPFLPDNIGEGPIDQWNVNGANGNQIIVSLCQSLASAMAEVIKEHYNAAVAVGHPFTTATVHVSPIDGLQFSFEFDDE